jgi:glutathione S-transferase
MPHLNWRELHSNLDRHYQKLSQRQSFIDTTLS